MAEEKKETKPEVKAKLEREYIIPLRDKWKHVPRYKRANKAIKAIKEFVAKHMRIYSRDLKKIKIDKFLNEVIWLRGIKKPPKKIKVKAIKSDDEIIKVEAFEIPEKLKFKKLKEEKREKEAGVSKKKVEEKEEVKEKTEEIEKEEEKKEEKEKKAAVVETGKELEKEAARKAKHEVGGKIKGPKKQFRKALKK